MTTLYYMPIAGVKTCPLVFSNFLSLAETKIIINQPSKKLCDERGRPGHVGSQGVKGCMNRDLLLLPCIQCRVLKARKAMNLSICRLPKKWYYQWFSRMLSAFHWRISSWRYVQGGSGLDPGEWRGRVKFWGRSNRSQSYTGCLEQGGLRKPTSIWYKWQYSLTVIKTSTLLQWARDSLWFFWNHWPLQKIIPTQCQCLSNATQTCLLHCLPGMFYMFSTPTRPRPFQVTKILYTYYFFGIDMVFKRENLPLRWKIVLDFILSEFHQLLLNLVEGAYNTHFIKYLQWSCLT